LSINQTPGILQQRRQEPNGGIDALVPLGQSFGGCLLKNSFSPDLLEMWMELRVGNRFGCQRESKHQGPDHRRAKQNDCRLDGRFRLADSEQRRVSKFDHTSDECRIHAKHLCEFLKRRLRLLRNARNSTATSGRIGTWSD